jgi:hypothetical protein
MMIDEGTCFACICPGFFFKFTEWKKTSEREHLDPDNFIHTKTLHKGEFFLLYLHNVLLKLTRGLRYNLLH